jgi:phospholipase C
MTDERSVPDTSTGPGVTRRTLLKAGVATAAVATAAGLPGAAGAATAPARASGLPADPADSGIDHIVVAMMENRSFDHFLGWLRGADGRQAGLSYLDGDGVAHPTHHLTDFQGLAFNDPDHSYDGGRVEFDGGACDGWLRAGDNDVYSIGYYQAADLAFYRHAAPYWTVCDRYFSSIMGPTFPNRFYIHSAQTDRISNTQVLATMPTIWDSLAAAGVSHRYYFSDIPFTALWGAALLGITAPIAEFYASAALGTLPAVSYIDPRFLGEDEGLSGDDHPHADIRVGQSFLNDVYTAVTSGPAWRRTALLITYDEWGGFFDHVPPGSAADPVPEHALRGFRVPTFVISPRARRNFVAHNTYDHSSIVKMIEWRFGLAPLTARDADARNIAEVLDFSIPPNPAAPRWNVPAPSSLTPAPVNALRAGLSTDHEAEWMDLRDLAARHGFAVR